MVKKLLFSLILVLLLVPTIVLAANDNTVTGNLQSFVDAFKAAFDGDTDGFVQGLVDSLPLFGLVVIIFGLMFFISKVTIFKSPDHDKYARMIAFGVAIIGLAQQAVYNVVLNLSRTFLILAFLVAIGFISVMFVNFNRKQHLSSHKELHGITGEALSARKDLEKIKHDVKQDMKLYERTEKDLQQLDSQLSNISHLVGNEKGQVDKLAELLRKATAAANTGDKGTVHQYVQALSRDIGSLVTTMKHESKSEAVLNDTVYKISRELARWGHNENKEKSEEDHFVHMFKKLSASLGKEFNDKDLKKEIFEKQGIVNAFQGIRSQLFDLQRLQDELAKHVEELEKSGYQQKHLEAQEVRTNVMNQQFVEAHKHLDNLRALIEREPHIISLINKNKSDIHTHLSAIDGHEKKLNGLVVELIKDLGETADKAKDKEDKLVNFGKKLKAQLNRAYLDAKKYASHARDLIVKTQSAKAKYGLSSQEDVKTFELPSRLLQEFSDIATKLQNLESAVAETIKKKKSPKDQLTEAINLIESLESMIHTSESTVNKTTRSEAEYVEIINAIKHLLEESKRVVSSEETSIKHILNELKEEDSK